MSVLGHKITDLTSLSSLQPSDVFVAIRGGVSYKIIGDRFVSKEQLNATRSDYTTKIATIQQTVDNASQNFETEIFNLSSLFVEDYMLKTTGEELSAKLDTTNTYMLSWTNANFLTKLSAQNTFVRLPGSEYEKQNGKVLTWNTAASAWIPGPGLAITSNIDLGPIGTIIWYAGTSAPYGYLLCNGSSVKKSDYPELWEAIGNGYGTPDEGASYFKLPDLLDVTVIDAPANIYIKALSSVRSAIVTELSGYIKLSAASIPMQDQYLKYSNGGWVASTPPIPILPVTAQLSSLLTWNGSSWKAGTPQVQSIYVQESIVANNNSQCTFINIPATAKRLTLVISNLDITPGAGSYVKLRLGNNSSFVNSGYKNACQGTYADPYIRTSNGYYSYTTNTFTAESDALYLLVRADTLESRETIGGLDTIVTLMRSQLSTLNGSSKWVCTHTGRIGASVIHGAGSVGLTDSAPTSIGLFSPNPSAVITTGQITLYWE